MSRYYQIGTVSFRPKEWAERLKNEAGKGVGLLREKVNEEAEAGARKAVLPLVAGAGALSVLAIIIAMRR